MRTVCGRQNSADVSKIQTIMSNIVEFAPHSSNAARMIEQRRYLCEVQAALALQKEDFAKKTVLFRQREHELQTKDLRFQDSMIKFNKLLHEDENKRNRALKRYASFATVVCGLSLIIYGSNNSRLYHRCSHE